jgi:hypothetical protein
MDSTNDIHQTHLTSLFISRDTVVQNDEKYTDKKYWVRKTEEKW